MEGDDNDDFEDNMDDMPDDMRFAAMQAGMGLMNDFGIGMATQQELLDADDLPPFLDPMDITAARYARYAQRDGPRMFGRAQRARVVHDAAAGAGNQVGAARPIFMAGRGAGAFIAMGGMRNPAAAIGLPPALGIPPALLAQAGRNRAQAELRRYDMDGTHLSTLFSSLSWICLLLSTLFQPFALLLYSSHF
jgi:hypothetical protein